jgi:outer membrane protein OmpA-like peptidoglycan-associated protein
MKKIMTLLSVACFMASTFAQTTTLKKRPTLSVNFLLNDFLTPDRIDNGSLGEVLKNHNWAKPSEMSPGLGLQYFNGITDYIDFTANLQGSFVDYPFLGKAKLGQDNFLLEADAGVNVKLLTDNHFFVPYLTAGFGASMYKGSYFGAYIPAGAGLQFNLGGSDAFLFTQVTYRMKVTDLTNYHLNYSLGFGSPLTEKKAVKVIPPPPAPVVVPVDTDKDGITDDVDKCPTVPGVAKYGGCPVPDTDKDGINDDNDKCPTVPGVAKYGGCPVPDTDKDGINDDDDKCPTVPGVARYHGCPIPDTDGDGLNDEEDKCPTVAGPKSNNGCPLPKITEEKKAKVNAAAHNIYFATGSALLLKKSYVALDQVVALLNETDNSTLGLDIEGHTDNVGKAASNLKLSDARANAVLAYLKKKGIDPKRLSAKGYGQTQPVADNKTSVGRAKNRRVEMKLKEM